MTSSIRWGEPVGSGPGAQVPQIAAAQAGVFTARQAERQGWSRKRIRKRLQVGFWVPVLGRGITLAGNDISAAQLGWATYLTMVKDASRDFSAASVDDSGWTSNVVSHMTAGAVFGFPLAGAVGGHIVASVHQSPAGIHVHRDQLSNSDVVRIGGLPLTTRRRTALDCLALLEWDEAVNLWAWLLSRQILTAEALAAAVRSRFGRRGTPTLIRLLSMARSGAASIAELRFHQLLRSARLSGWHANVQVRDVAGVIAVADVLFPAERLVIEIDGFAVHSGRARFVADRRRQNRLIAAGYTVFHVTWDDLRDRPEAVLADLRAVLLRLSLP
ncbi:MAG TPA: type IV toxin-antitoxin system AbiEi family antitoxin domain-containing protein [Kineosporiaceae bacterium]|nr:type IV toxin-antitoxin system AbiEi family antitoxin domain-containing protein [Kineosporiaceae bacterium]